MLPLFGVIQFFRSSLVHVAVFVVALEMESAIFFSPSFVTFQFGVNCRVKESALSISLILVSSIVWLRLCLF